MLKHFKNFCFFVAILAISALFISPAHGQSNDPPSGQFGLGLYVAAGANNLASGGLDALYAINKNVQVGTIFNLGVTSPGSTTFQLAPFFRYQFSSTISPYLGGGFSILVRSSQTYAGLFLGGGLAYYFATHFGIHTDVDIVTLVFSPSTINFGWVTTRIAASGFFSRLKRPISC